MLKFQRYLYYKLYKFFWSLHKPREVDDYTEGALITINGCYIGGVYVLIFGFPSEVYKIVLFYTSVFLIHLFYFSKKRKEILEEFKDESNKQRIIGRWFTISYVLGAGLLFLYALIYGK